MDLENVLTAVSGPAFDLAPKINLLAFFRALGRSPAAVARVADAVYRFQTPVNYWLFNGVVLSRPPRGDERELIAATEADFAAYGMPDFAWWLDPDVLSERQAAAWGEQLRACGYLLVTDMPGMAVDLAQVRPTAPVPGLEIRRVHSDAELAVWTDTFSVGYELESGFDEQFYHLLAGMGFDWPQRIYLGYLDGRPAATSILFYGAGTAGIYCVSTVPEFRRRGLGAALTVQPLLELRALGCRVGILQASEMGLPVYERIGFRTTVWVDKYLKGA